jgi:uncharacterized protein
MDAEGIEDSMDISTLDGSLTAIVCGPKTILPSEWLRWVWNMESGEDALQSVSQAQAKRILGLSMRHNDGDPIPILDEWCSGFMKGCCSIPQAGYR